MKLGPATKIVNNQLKLPLPPSVVLVYDVMFVSPTGTFVTWAGNAAPTRNPNAMPATTTINAVARNRLARPLLSDNAHPLRAESGSYSPAKATGCQDHPPIGNPEDS